MGLIVRLKAEGLEEFEKWRKANAKPKEVILLEPVSKRHPDAFKVWFEKAVPGCSTLSWYKPVEDTDGAAAGDKHG